MNKIKMDNGLDSYCGYMSYGQVPNVYGSMYTLGKQWPVGTPFRN